MGVNSLSYIPNHTKKGGKPNASLLYEVQEKGGY